jgi:predicted GIY-YIG superfamily endonuclease
MIYLIHFSEPLSHARHYIGFVDGDIDQVQARLAEHRAGWGAKILAECNRRGIAYDVVATRPGDRAEERRLKRYHKGSQICPICSPSKTYPAIKPPSLSGVGMGVGSKQP